MDVVNAEQVRMPYTLSHFCCNVVIDRLYFRLLLSHKRRGLLKKLARALSWHWNVCRRTFVLQVVSRVWQVRGSRHSPSWC